MIERESKSWAWVNERPCDQCGFDASSTDPTEVADLVRDNMTHWPLLFARAGARVGVRPDPATWSALEYACHVRDVYELLAYRFDRVRREDHPAFEDWHPDDRAAAGDYASQDPGEVLAKLLENGSRLASAAEAMTVADWERTGVRADGLEFTAGWLSTYLTHDVIHHAHDVEQGLTALESAN